MDTLYREVLRRLLGSSTENGDCCKDLENLFSELGRGQRRNMNITSAGMLRHHLQRRPELFKLEGNSVSPTTTLTLCRAHSNKSGSCQDRGCEDLHVCIFFLLSGNCPFEDRCHFGHDLKTAHNQRLLREHHLHSLNITDLRTLFCQPGVRQGISVPQVCRYYNKSQGCGKKTSCRSLHLCSFYVLGLCKFVERCQHNHDITDPQVRGVLTLYGIKLRRPADILRELRIYMNHGRKSDQDTDDDEDVHVRTLARGAGGATPKRFGSVPNLSRGVTFSSGPVDNGARQRNTSESIYFQLAHGTILTPKVEKICRFHLQGTCKFNERCNLLHNSESFLWRLAPSTAQENCLMWTSLPTYSNLALEQAYSQPQMTSHVVTDKDGNKLEVKFRHMTARDVGTSQTYNVRRVSTPSSMDQSMKKGQASIFATKWLWYWRRDNGLWQEFGLEENGSLSVTSDEVEMHFLTSVDVPMAFAAFILDFTKMRLKDTTTGQKFKVRRRPELVLRNHDAESDDESDSDDNDSANEDPVPVADEGRPGSEDDNDRDDDAAAMAEPIHAVAMAEPIPVPAKYTLTLLQDDSQEFSKVQRPFTMTMGVRTTILSIHKVINRQLAANYDRQKVLMTESGKKRISEKWLYYGPSRDKVKAICAAGVNCNPTGASRKTAMPLGKGGYFYVNASQADRSNGRNARERRVFVMKCLVGTSAVGSPGMVLPPPLDPYNISGKKNDSCVDDTTRPRVYVIFDTSQVCPLYLITYQRD